MSIALDDLLRTEITENTIVNKTIEIKPIELRNINTDRVVIVMEKSKKLLKILRENDIVILK